jgi:apolipoprotein N-acyltransferase
MSQLITASFAQFGQRIRELSRFQRAGLAFLAGVLAMVTLPPLSLYGFIVPAYAGLVLLTETARRSSQAFLVGWAFGMGYFVPGLYWFAHALLVEAEKFAWMIPFAILGLPAILSLYYAVACWLYYRLPIRQPIARVILFSLLWLGIELLRGFLFTGFPWNLAAYSWSFSLPMLQMASLIGAYGLSAWTVLLAMLPALLFWPKPCRPAEVNIALSMTVLMLLVPFGYGMMRLDNGPTRYTDQLIRIVQANIPQAHKWDPTKQRAVIDKHLGLSIPSTGERVPDVIIWPEAAYPYMLEAASPPVEYIMQALPEGALWLTGAMRAQQRGDSAWDVWNSLAVVNRDAQIISHYNKHRLVPFGEFVPLRGLIPMEKKITHGMKDFSRGAGVQLLDVEGVAPFLPLICYEAVFPQLAEHPQKQRAGWLLNITNDAWFGDSIGPYQHLEAARMRAIEQGMPLVRAANTGISVVTDSYGRVVENLALLQTGYLQTTLPEALDESWYYNLGLVKVLTFYSVFMLLLAGLFVNFSCRR